MPLKPCFVFTGLAILFAGMSWAAPRPQESPAARIFAANAGDQTIEIQVEKSRNGVSETDVLRLAPGEIAEVRRSSAEEVRIPDQRDLLIVSAAAGFEPSAVSFGRPELPERAAVEGGEEGRIPFRRKAAAGPRLNRGETAAAQVLRTGAEPMIVSLRLHGNAAAEVRALRPDGSVLGWVSFGASRDLEVKVDLGGFPQMKGSGGVVRQEVIVRRGQVSTATAGAGTDGGLQRVAEAVIVGTGSFNKRVHYTTSSSNLLTYTVTNGPASTCGELNTYRNNSWLFGPGWLCTDSSGYKLQGPWTSAPSNQTDDPAFIRWPDGSTTTNDWHIWDTSCPSIQLNGNPPASWNGIAFDAPFGACFASRTNRSTYSYFRNLTTGLYYRASTGLYSETSRYDHTGTFSGEFSSGSSCGASWTSPYPPANIHVAGSRYKWTVCVNDGGCVSCGSIEYFY